MDHFNVCRCSKLPVLLRAGTLAEGKLAKDRKK